MKKIYVEYLPPRGQRSEPAWFVTKVVGDVSFHPGQLLGKACMQDLCRMTGTWVVIITAETQS